MSQYSWCVSPAADSRGVSQALAPPRFLLAGCTGWPRAAAIADATGIPMSAHLYREVSGHLLRVTSSRHWLERQGRTGPTRLLAHPFEVRSGELHLPDVPGNGLEWDDGAVAGRTLTTGVADDAALRGFHGGRSRTSRAILQTIV